MAELKDILQPSGDPEIPSAKIGTGANYIEIEPDGTIHNHGDATAWDDVRTSPTRSDLTGARVPHLETILTDGSATTGSSLEFDKTTGVDIPYYAAMNAEDITINIWIKPNNVNSTELIDRDDNGYFELYYDNRDLKFQWANNTLTASNVIVAGQTMMITAKAKKNGTSTELALYVNGAIVNSSIITSVIPTTSTNGYRLGEWRNGGWEYEGLLDGLYIYNVPLTDAQVLELYNGGAGTMSHPTGIDESTEVISKFDFNEDGGNSCDNDCTLGAGHDIVLPASGIIWGDGLMGVTTGSLGVKALAFEPNKVQEIFGTAQLPHSYKEGSDIFPHPHFMFEYPNELHVVWKLEYVWTNVNFSYGNTTIGSRAISNTTTDKKHNVADVPSSGLNGTDKSISSVFHYRLYRDGTDALDTFQGKVYLSEFDIHFQIDTMGSRTTWVK